MSEGHLAAFRDLTDKKDVVFHGPGSFQLGLSADGCIVVEPIDSESVCVLLLELTSNPSGGFILAPANFDLPCFINESEELTGEINLINGTRLEVANKTLVFIDGPIPVRRRKLPRTPGTPLEEGPPNKPVRAQKIDKDEALPVVPDHFGDKLAHYNLPRGSEDENSDPDDDDNGEEEEEEDRRWLETSWCKLDLPTAEQNLFADLNTPEQISIVAASYFCKQVRLFTDANPTMQHLDDIFKLFKDSVMLSKDIFLNYLLEISEKIKRSPRNSQTRPMHGPAIKLLNNLLKQALEPLSRVILLLDLLRTFSHFDSNMATMTRQQVSATILGCMTVHSDVVEVQSCGLEALARIAKFKPTPGKKAPLREGAVQIVLKSEQQHHKNLAICRSVCRVLANLAASFTDVTNSLLDTESAVTSEMLEAVETYESMLLFMFQQALPVVQNILDHHGKDLGVHTEGRRFVYYYAKLPQLQQKKKVWVAADLDETETDIGDETDTSGTTIQNLKSVKLEENEPHSILKRAGSFENLRDPTKKIVFADDTVGGSDSESSSSDEESFKPPFEYEHIPIMGMEEDFSAHLMKQFIGNSFGKKKYNADFSDSSDDEKVGLKVSVKPLAISGNGKSNVTLNNLKPSPLVSDIEISECANNVQNNNNEEECGDMSLTHPNDSHKLDESDNVSVQLDTNLFDNEEDRRKEFPVDNTSENETDRDSEIKEDESEVLSVARTTTPNVCHSVTDSKQESFTANNTKSGNIVGASDLNCVSNDKFDSTDSGWDIIDNDEFKDFEKIGAKIQKHSKVDKLICEKSEIVVGETKGNVKDAEATVSTQDDNGQSNSCIIDRRSEKEDFMVVSEMNAGDEVKPTSRPKKSKDCSVVDVPFMGKLVRTQIVTHVGSLVFQGDDSKVLLVIDQPITELLEHAAAPEELVHFARNQYGKDMTLMDLEPSIVISAIDAVRYRSVTAELVQNAVLSLTRAITHVLQPSTVNTTMLFFKALFTDANIKSIITDKKFVQDFKVCFSNATQRLQTSHSIEEIRARLSSPV